MADLVTQRRGVRVLVCGAEGAPIASTQDALDIIGAAFSQADVVAVPVSRLDQRFFSLRSGLAGDIVQKFANYRMRLAVVGDISAQIAASEALRDLVRESNRSHQLWFVADLDELDTRLGGSAQP
jgi:hypothetical protein